MQQLGEAPFPFDLFVALAWLGLFLVIGIFIRNSSKFMQKWLVPSCMLGGLAGLFILTGMNHVFSEGGTLLPNEPILQAITWHMYTILFIGIIMNTFIPRDESPKTEGEKGAGNIRSGFWMGCTYNGLTALQKLVGCLAILLCTFIFGKQVIVSSGQLVGAAFAGGPGPAMGMAAVWQQAGHQDLISIALGYAGIGFLFSLFIGVTVVNFIRRKMCIEVNDEECIPVDERKGYYPKGNGDSAGKLTFMESNVETLAFIISVIFIVYVSVYAILTGIKLFLPVKIMAMLWNMFPVICIFLTFIFGMVARTLGLFRFIDKGLLARVQGFLVDFMGVAALMSINLKALLKYAPMMLTVSVLVIGITMVYLWWMTRTLKEDPAGNLAVLTGWGTGTVTSGFILLRMIDPKMQTGVSVHVGVAQLFVSAFGFGLAPFLMAFHNGEALLGWTFWPIIIVCLIEFLVYTVVARLPFLHVYGKKANF